MSNTLDLNVANLREIAIFFGVTSEVAKAIAAGAPSSLRQLISISGFPSTFFESNTTCNVIFMENTNLRRSSMMNNPRRVPMRIGGKNRHRYPKMTYMSCYAVCRLIKIDWHKNLINQNYRYNL